MKTIIRETRVSDHQTTISLTREAFWNIYKPGCDEHLALKQLRESEAFIPDLDLVAECNNKILGHIICTKAKVINDQNIEFEVVCLGPVSVWPELQLSGIGTLLITETIRITKEKGYAGIILYGNPDYYHRFGFVNAEKYGISTRDGANFEPFMALELNENSLSDIKGRFFETNAFFTNENDLEAFEKQFPSKEKLVTDTQLKDLK